MAEQGKSFLANWLSGRLTKKEQQEEQELQIDPLDAKPIAQTLPHTILAFTPEQEAQFSKKEKEKYREYCTMMPPAKIGEINFIAVEIGRLMGGIYVRVFVRHARDLEEEFTLDVLPLSLYDAAGDLIAHGVFKPEGFGTLRFGETRLWTFAWRESDLLKKDPDLSDFYIRIEQVNQS